MVSAIFSDLFIRGTFWGGIGVIGLTLVVVALIMLMRLLAGLRKRRNRRFVAYWRPLLVQSMFSETMPLSSLPARDWFRFYLLWSHLLQNVKGDARRRLARCGQLSGFAHAALSKLSSGRGGFRTQLAAILSMGYAGEVSAFGLLAEKLRHDNPLLSIAAARSLLLLDPAAGSRLVIPYSLERRDWPPAMVAGLFKEVDPAYIAEPLAEQALTASPERIPQLVRCLAGIELQVAGRVIRALLDRHEEPEIISACLQAASDPGLLPQIRAFLSHPSWAVRVQAAKALGRLGGGEDRKHLIPLLGDQEWWVRYRAAQALAALPLVSRSELERLSASHADRYARDMLQQVMAEELRP